MEATFWYLFWSFFLGSFENVKHYSTEHKNIHKYFTFIYIFIELYYRIIRKVG